MTNLVIVDGSNLLRNAFENSPEVLELVELKLSQEGYDFYFIFDASVKYDFEGEERERFEEVLNRENYEESPPFTDADILIIEKLKMVASNKVLTNDLFEEYKDEHPILKNEEKFIRYDFEKWKNGKLEFGWAKKREKEMKGLEGKIKKALG